MRTAKIIRDNHGSLEERATGLGEISDSQICSRAAELAVIDGRKGEEFTDADYETAREELSGSLFKPDARPPLEVNGTRLPEQAVSSSGHRSVKSEFEEEETIGEHLVRDGVEEAQHDEMLEAGKKALRDEDLEK